MKKSTIVAVLAAIVLMSCNPGTVPDNVQDKFFDSAKVTVDSTGQIKAVSNAPVHGVDISSFQGREIDFLDRHKHKLTFVICKATEGINYEDADFDTNWVMIKRGGFIRGAYHFYHCDDDPVKQARYFTSVVGGFLKTDLPPIVDFEELSIDAGCEKANIQANLLKFLSELENITKRTPIIYTDNNTGNAYLNNKKFAEYPLYIADYINKASPVFPATWQNWLMWQKYDTLKIDRQDDDFDLFNGNTDSLKKFIQVY